MRPRAQVVPTRRAALVGRCCLVLAAAAAGFTAGPVAAQTPPPSPAPKLGITAVGQQKGFFELSMAPGERRELAVELVNRGDGPVTAVSYPAEVYTIVNGGFGARLRGEHSGGVSSWLRYSTDVLELGPGSGITRTFTVAVPPGTSPGEYIASVVIENRDPVKGSGAVALDQVVRQAVAVAITVPGPAQSGLGIGGARHVAVGGRSIVAVGVENTGKLRLRPAGELVVSDASGRALSRSRVTMDSFYAGTATQVEVPLDRLLEPGRYLVSLSLADPERGASAAKESIPLEVPKLDKGAIGADPTRKARAEEPGGTPLWAVLAAGTALVTMGMVLALGGAALVRRRRAGRESG